MSDATDATSAKPTYSPGLEGVIAGESAICTVQPTLMYRGYAIEELAQRASFEQVIWLLLEGELPDDQQDRDLRQWLDEESTLPDAAISMLELMPPHAHPIDVLRTGVSMLASFDPELDDTSHAANMRKAIRIIAKMSTLSTSAWRIAQDQDPFVHRPGINHAARFLSNLTGTEPEDWQIAAFTTVLILYAEHEFNASTFSARVTASTLADIYAAVTAALATLKGPLHGGANEASMKMLREIASPDKAEDWIMQRLARKEKIMGFGHRVYKKGDSRVPAVRQLTRELGQRLGQEHWADICQILDDVMAREKNLYANLDLYAAPVLAMLGIPPELDISVFALARAAGWCAHVIEQHDHNRLIRPRSLYTGPSLRPFPAPSPRPDLATPYPGTATRERDEAEDPIQSPAWPEPQRPAARPPEP